MHGWPLDALPSPLNERLADETAKATVAKALDAAAATLPRLSVERAELVRGVLARLPEGPVDEALAQLHVADLLVATAAAAGDRDAIAHVERACFGEIGHALRKTRAALGEDEVAQVMRERLFVAAADGPARIAQYSGAGPLRAWFRVAVTRYLLNVVTRAPKEQPLGEALLAAVPTGALDPELEHVRDLYRGELAAAFRDAAEELGERDRGLLRAALAGRTVDELGEEHGVHRATAARWVQAARQTLERRIRALLAERLGAGDESIESVLRAARDHVELSVGRHLGPRDGD